MDLVRNKQAFIEDGQQSNRLNIQDTGNSLTLRYDRAGMYQVSYKTATQRSQALALLKSLYNQPTRIITIDNLPQPI